MSPWIRVLEAYLIAALLRQPAFHRAVEKVARQVHRIRHGIPPDELRGTKIDGPKDNGFLGHFLDEIKSQLGKAEGKDTAGVNIDRRVMDPQAGRQRATKAEMTPPEDESADAVWHTASKDAKRPPKRGFLGEYTEALREQIRTGERRDSTESGSSASSFPNKHR
nr:hypothetical protein CFP56_69661 [Quercus suber]